MRIHIATVRMVDGASLNPRWKAPMYLVNDQLVASSIDEHNIHGEPYDLYTGHTYNVSLKIHDGHIWIARSPKTMQTTTYPNVTYVEELDVEAGKAMAEWMAL